MLYLIIGVALAALAVTSFFADSSNRDDHSRSYESQPPVRRRDERQSRQTVEPSRRDEEERDPASLRARAKQEGNLMAQCAQQSQEAYERRDHARAKVLSEERKLHEYAMKNLDAQASAIIYEENNRDRAACEVDLHGLYVKEAIVYSEMAIEEARRGGLSEVRLIVGKGNHSDGGIAKLKPAIQEVMQIRGIPVEIDPKNPGVLLIRVGGRCHDP